MNRKEKSCIRLLQRDFFPSIHLEQDGYKKVIASSWVTNRQRLYIKVIHFSCKYGFTKRPEFTGKEEYL